MEIVTKLFADMVAGVLIPVILKDKLYPDVAEELKAEST